MDRSVFSSQWGSVILSAAANLAPLKVVETYRPTLSAGGTFDASGAGLEAWAVDPASVNVHGAGGGGAGVGSVPGRIEFASGGASWIACDSGTVGGLLVDLIDRGAVVGRVMLTAGTRVRVRVTALQVVGVANTAGAWASARLMFGVGACASIPDLWPGQPLTYTQGAALGDAEKTRRGQVLWIPTGLSTAQVAKLCSVEPGWSIVSGVVTAQTATSNLVPLIVCVPLGAAAPVPVVYGAVVAQADATAERIISRYTSPASSSTEVDPNLAGYVSSGGCDVYVVAQQSTAATAGVNFYASYRFGLRRGA